jgi:hypothetical protein
LLSQPKCEEVTGDWRKMHNEKLHDLGCLLWHLSLKGTIKIHLGFLLENLKEKRHLGRPRRRWNDNIKIYLKYDGRFGLDLTDWGQGPRVNIVNKPVIFLSP